VTGEDDYRAFRDWLTHKYSNLHFDVVAAIGSNALHFINSYGQGLFGGADVVFWGRKDGLKNWTLDAPITGAVAPEMASSVTATIKFILDLQPDLKNLTVVWGASEIDKR